jgi:hypothetical protein
LSKEAQEKAIEELSDINVNSYEWWETTFDDAKEVGLQITSFDIDRRQCEGNFIESAEEVCKLILENHGASCGTYQDAEIYKSDLEREKRLNLIKNVGEECPEDFLDTEELDSDFLETLLEDYRLILSQEYSYLTSREAVIQSIEVNNWEFLENGKLDR